MKVTITHMKAPWPTGARPGDVVNIATDKLPAWAAGKCAPAADDAEAAFSWSPPGLDTEEERLRLLAPEMAEHYRQQAMRAIDAATAQLTDEVTSLRERLDAAGGDASLLEATKQAEQEAKRLLADAEAALAARTIERDNALAELSDAKQKLADAEAALAAKGKKAS